VRLAKLYVEPTQFARQMACLKRFGLRGVSVGEALALRAQGRAGNVVAITFDDGYLDNLREAAPILREFGFGATCYVVTGTLGQYNVWDAELLKARKPLMTAQDLRAWLREGFELGSHTRSHPRLDEIDPATLEDEIAGSRADLERLTGARIEHFCYPYGCYDDRVVKVVAAAGYVSAVTTERGRVTSTDDPLRLPRISINGNRGLLRFVLKAATPYGGWRKLKTAA
jgi:peptidoglycan/xylan/chitin deacetylase (PgdA/CDA1 family)